jgi:tetratricopeptide (TPR) repeat protein
MFNIILALVTGVLIGWSFHSFFMELGKPNILKNEFNLSSKIEATKNVVKADKEPTTIETDKFPQLLQVNKQLEKRDSTDPFYKKLKEGHFSDAMAIYLDTDDTHLKAYRVAILEYFKTQRLKYPHIAIQEMLEYMELEVKNQEVTLLLIETYKEKKAYLKAIDLIIKLIEEDENTQLHSNLIQTSQSYIDELKREKQFQELIAFIEERINEGIEVPFYMYTLAQYFFDIEEYSLSIEKLKEIEFDENYEERVKILLEKISKKLKQK